MPSTSQRATAMGSMRTKTLALEPTIPVLEMAAAAARLAMPRNDQIHLRHILPCQFNF
jgi:hypothetical protein